MSPNSIVSVRYRPMGGDVTMSRVTEPRFDWEGSRAPFLVLLFVIVLVLCGGALKTREWKMQE